MHLYLKYLTSIKYYTLSSNSWPRYIPKCPTHRFVAHRRLVLAAAPETRHGLGVVQAEDALVAIDPADEARTVLGSVEQLQEKLPEVARVAGSSPTPNALPPLGVDVTCALRRRLVLTRGRRHRATLIFHRRPSFNRYLNWRSRFDSRRVPNGPCKGVMKQ